jgi:hypothetical protein
MLVINEMILEDFFRSLRVTLTNAFSYSTDHPYFIKSVENFKLKLESVLSVLSPFKIGVTSSGLVVDGKNLTRIGFYDELARLLHQRKIKSIEIKIGVNLQELIKFFSVISLPQKEIFKSGGINLLLNKQQLTHFSIEELDYSAFLQGVGKECVDIWGYMLKEGTYSNDPVKLNRLADDFGPLIKRFNEKDIFESAEVSSDINEFLVGLRQKNKEKFDKCAKEFFLWLLNNKKSLDEEKLAKFRSVFSGLNHEDFSSLLWDGLLYDDNFDILSLQLFSKISERKNEPEIAEKFLDKMNVTAPLKDHPKAQKRIQDLLNGAKEGELSAVYRNTLESLVKGISYSGNSFFDQKALKENYRYIVLGLLSMDEEGDNLKLAAEALEKELPSIFEENNVGFLKDLSVLLVKRKKEGVGACINLEKKFSAFIENIVLDKYLPSEQEFLLEMITFPSREMGSYLDKIFTPGRVNKRILNLFFRLFPGNLDELRARIGKRLQDMEFLSGFVDVLGQLNAPGILDILEYIYSSANELMKSETLKAMYKLKKVDVAFLMRELGTDSLLIRKSLLSILMLDEQGKKSALDSLLKIPGFWGSKNDLILENMKIIFDLRLVEAIDYIRDLSRRRFFWNRKLRNKAKQILKEWNDK